MFWHEAGSQPFGSLIQLLYGLLQILVCQFSKLGIGGRIFQEAFEFFYRLRLVRYGVMASVWRADLVCPAP
jgi:hypothetical protein